MFTFLAVKATSAQLQITEQGQITDRYNAAITNLGSAATDTRLGCIYALQRIMQDSSRDQSTIIAVLCAYVRDHPPRQHNGSAIIDAISSGNRRPSRPDRHRLPTLRP